jgi:hypothetical protein
LVPPSWIWSPSLSLKRVMRRPLTCVPFELLRSWTQKSSPCLEISACSLEILAVGELEVVDGVAADAGALQELELAGGAVGGQDEDLGLNGGGAACSADGPPQNGQVGGSGGPGREARQDGQTLGIGLEKTPACRGLARPRPDLPSRS